MSAVFLASTVGELFLARVPGPAGLLTGYLALIVGMGFLALSLATSSFGLLLIGGMIAGFGQGLGFRAGLTGVVEMTAPEHCGRRQHTHRAASAPGRSPPQLTTGATMTTTPTEQDHTPTTRVGLLGIGLMGSAMTHRLLNEGFPVTVWDRDRSHVEPLGPRGADLAGSAGEVVSAADVVITMLSTAEAVLSVTEPLLAQWPRTTVWLQMSSVGAAESDELARVAADHGVIQFDAPVSGSTHPAEEGKLTILASGPDSARPQVEPVLAALASRIQWVGQAGMGSRLKLAANHWMITMVAALAETMRLCERMDLDQQQFVALLDGGPLGSSYAVDKLGEMSRHEYPAGFPVRLAVKDLGLVREVAQSTHEDMPLLNAAFERMSAVASSHGDDDLAAVYELS